MSAENDDNLLTHVVQHNKLSERNLTKYVEHTWTPCNLRDTDAIESVQRCSTKRLPGLSRCPYGARLQQLSI